jgi:threonine/homoserine/homoserine lactone efflux protein
VGNLLGQLIPTAIVGALAPLPIIIVVTLLMSKGGLVTVIGFGAALVAVFAVIGVIVLATSSGGSGSGSKASAVTGTIIAVLGVLFVLLAVKQLLHAPDPDAPPPKFMTALDFMSPVRAAVFGVVIALINVKQLGIYVGGVAMIVHADVSAAARWVALVILLVVVQIGAIGAIAAYAADRDWTSRKLQRFRGWMVAHNRVISIPARAGDRRAVHSQGRRADRVRRVIVAGAGPSGQRIGRRRARTEHLVLPCG